MTNVGHARTNVLFPLLITTLVVNKRCEWTYRGVEMTTSF